MVLNALGYPKVPVVPTKLDDNRFIQLKVKFDPATGSTVPEEEVLDFQKVIESYREQCGVEFMIKQVKLGAISLASLADDGQHGADIAGSPDNINDAYQAAVVGNDNIAGLEKALDVNLEGLTQEQAEAAIKGKLAEIYAAVQKKEVNNDAE